MPGGGPGAELHSGSGVGQRLLSRPALEEPMSAVSAFPAGDAAAAGASAAAAVFGAAVSPSVNAAAAAASALQLDEEEEEECAAEKGESTAEEKAARRDAAILKQVEFYFSDANLPTDEFLLGRIRANKHGWVPLHTIVRFNKMKRLCKGECAVAAAALRSSSALEVNASGTSVRRLAPLPPTDPFEIGARTVVAENLAPGCTAESVTVQFGSVGVVRMVRLCAPTGSTAGGSTLHSAAAADPWGALSVSSTQQHALVEYESRAGALAAVEQLNDAKNWRTGLRVRLVRREVAKAAMAPRDGEGEDGAAHVDEAVEPSAPAPTQHPAGAGRGRGRKEKPPKRDYAAWASVGAHKESLERERVAAAGSLPAPLPPPPPPTLPDASPPPAEARAPRRFAPQLPAGGGAGAAAPGSGAGVREARMPDGTRGFAAQGRGRSLAPPHFAAPQPPVV